MNDAGQNVKNKWLVRALMAIIGVLGGVCWFFFTSFYQSTLEIQKSLQEIKLSVVKIQSEMMTDERVRTICRYEILRNNNIKKDGNQNE